MSIFHDEQASAEQHSLLDSQGIAIGQLRSMRGQIGDGIDQVIDHIKTAFMEQRQTNERLEKQLNQHQITQDNQRQTNKRFEEQFSQHQVTQDNQRQTNERFEEQFSQYQITQDDQRQTNERFQEQLNQHQLTQENHRQKTDQLYSYFQRCMSKLSQHFEQQFNEHDQRIEGLKCEIKILTQVLRIAIDEAKILLEQFQRAQLHQGERITEIQNIVHESIERLDQPQNRSAAAQIQVNTIQRQVHRQSNEIQRLLNEVQNLRQQQQGQSWYSRAIFSGLYFLSLFFSVCVFTVFLNYWVFVTGYNIN